MRPVSELLEKLNIKPKHISLYETAFTHSSYNADANTKHHDYERMEFLGDSVIGLVVSEVSLRNLSILAKRCSLILTLVSGLKVVVIVLDSGTYPPTENEKLTSAICLPDESRCKSIVHDTLF